MSAPLFRKWNRWLDRIFNEQLQDLLINQHIFQQFGDCTKPYVGTYTAAELAEWMTQGYLAFASTAIRRLVEPPKNNWKSISLVILLEDIGQHHALFTRQWQRRRYRQAFSKDHRWIAEKQADKDFDRIAGNKRASCLPKQRVHQDIVRLKIMAKPICRLVNKVIAHTEADRRKIGRIRYSNIESMIALAVNTYQKYCLLIKGSVCEPIVPLGDFDVRSDLKKIWM